MNFNASTSLESTADFLQGGGEMGQLTRSYDWASSCLGDPNSWPLSLRTTLNIILKSKFPMFLWWGKDLIQFYNDAYRPSLGMNGKHPVALGQKGADCWQEIWPVIKPLIDDVLAGKDSVWSEDQLIPIYRNGQLEDVYWTFGYSPVNDDNGNISGVLVVCTETTGKMLSLKRLADSEEQLRFAIESAELGTWDLDPDTRKFTGNERLKKWFGMRPETEINLTDAINTIAEPDRARVTAAIEKALDHSSGGNYDVEYTIIHPQTGYARIVCAKGKAHFNEEGRAYRFNGTLEDVTAHSVARRKLEEAEEKSRLTIEAANFGTFEIDLAERIMIASPRLNAIYGISNTNKLDDYVKIIHPDDLPLRTEAYKKAKETGVIDYEARIIKNDGSVHWVRATGKIYFNAQKEPARLLGVVQDITEQKLFSEELSKQVKERTAELNRSNEDLLQFAHVTSHDLKEPIRKIKIYSNKVQEEFGEILPKPGQTSLEKVQKAADRMLAMIEGVLTFSSLNAKSEATDFIDLNVIFKNIIADLEVLATEKKAVFNKEGMPTVEGTAVLIYQLFYNIIYNALKFSNPDTAPQISISSTTEKTNDREYAVVVITDNGIGFEQQYADRIFETFSRLHPKDRYEGTGLGLALCRKIAERHGGSITAAGMEGRGASFTIVLPLQQHRL